MKQIPFSPPDITEIEILEVAEALRSGWITTGARTKLFEKNIAAYTGTPCAVALNSATAALELTLRIWGIGPGDEVITSAYTYTASASVIAHVGARIVLVDTQRGSYEMDYEALENAITEKTKAIIPVDIGGCMCDYDTILAIAERKKHLFRAATPLQAVYGRVLVLSDAAHSFGAVRGGKKSGQAADVTCFSFHAVKNLTTGEGGAAVWRLHEGLSNEDLYREYMLYSLHGQSKDALAKTKLGAWEYDIVYTGYKCNMTDTLAAIGLKQLERYDAMLARRRSLIDIYNKKLADAPVNVLAHSGDDFASSCHLYLTRADAAREEKRNAIITYMAQHGVACNVHFKPLPMFTAYKALGFSIDDYPCAFAQYRNEITLPLHTLLTDEDATYVADTFLKALQEA